MNDQADVLSFAPAYVAKRLEAALEADEAGDVATALAEVESALRVSPQDARARALAGVYCGLLDFDTDALIHARRALRLSERADAQTRAEVAYWVGVARHMAGADEAAIEALDVTLSLVPEDAAAAALRDRCLSRIGAFQHRIPWAQ